MAKNWCSAIISGAIALVARGRRSHLRKPWFRRNSLCNGEYIVQFNRADLQSFNGGNPDGEAVDLMITGKLQHNGHTAGFATSATVRVRR